MSEFPIIRPRRLRSSSRLRDLFQENKLSLSDLVYPMFVRTGETRAISSMPGISQFSIDSLVEEVKSIEDLGIRAIMLFGIPEVKDDCGSDNFSAEGIVPSAIRAIKKVCPEMIVISDMCFCEYTEHGHCGLVNSSGSKNYNKNLPEGYLLNDQSLELLANASVVHAQSGADIIAPSGMLDGMVTSIRQGLDSNDFSNIPIISYAAKFASGFYGPFREAADGAPKFGDRSQYQMNPANGAEALREVELDISEGADVIMVKPALAYLDVIARVSDNFNIPVAAYNVSGEYSMLHAAAKNNWLDLETTAMESLLSIKRAGASMIFTYFAKDVASWLEA